MVSIVVMIVIGIASFLAFLLSMFLWDDGWDSGWYLFASIMFLLLSCVIMDVVIKLLQLKALGL